jgi:Zn-dependent protease
LSVKIGSLFGVPVRLHFTLILAVLLIAWTLAAGFMPAEYPGLSSIQYWVIGIIGAIGLFTSVLIHELAHSYVAKKNGLPVKRIVLFIFGGVSEIEEEPKDPRLEFKMAVVGPASSLAIGVVLFLAWYLLNTFGLSPLIIAPMEYIGEINLLLGGFNLLPAFPIDGGRVLRAVLWKRKNDFIGATKTATRVGIAFSYLFMFGGLALIFFGPLINGLWFVLIGWFLKNGAESSLNQTVVSEALAGVSIRDIMTRNVHTVDPDTSVKDVMETHFLQYKHGGFPVEKDSKLLGLITLEDIRKSPREKWQETKVGDVMTSCEKLKCASPDELAVDALMKMSKQDIGRLPVQEDGKLVGIVTRSDILHAIRVRTELKSKH